MYTMNVGFELTHVKTDVRYILLLQQQIKQKVTDIKFHFLKLIVLGCAIAIPMFSIGTSLSEPHTSGTALHPEN